MTDPEFLRYKKYDSICDQFEIQWQGQSTSKIHAFLDQVEPQDRNELLELLLELDVQLRLDAGLSIDKNDYQHLGADAVKLVDRLTHEKTVVGAPPQIASKLPGSKKTTKRIGPYQLEKKLGEGGMGSVWLAQQDEPIRRKVALKLIKFGLDSEQVVKRFEIERKAIAMMDHPNIAKVLDAGTTSEGQPFFVMELVEGVPITEYCDQQKLTPEQRLELFIPVCHAIHHAHQKGIIHRDLKPSNILVSLSDTKAIPKVIDFGLAKALQDESLPNLESMMTEFGQVVGTIQYMSPEQAELDSAVIDVRTDIYSLGIVLYELLTGSTPIEKKSLNENALLNLLAFLREHEPPKPSERLSSTGDAISDVSDHRSIAPKRLRQILQGELDWIIMKALEREPDRRYPSVNDFAEDIEHYLNNDPVRARPQSRIYRLKKIIRKHKGLVTSLALITFAILAGIVTSTWFAIKANSSAKSEKKLRELADQKTEAATLAETDAKNYADQLSRQKQTLESTLAASNFQLAVSRFAEFRPAEALAYLAKIPEKFREFEWHYARKAFEGSSMTLYTGDEKVENVVFTPDSSRIISRGIDGITRIWNATTGELVAKFDCFEVAERVEVKNDRLTVIVGDDPQLAVFNGLSFGRGATAYENEEPDIGVVIGWRPRDFIVAPDSKRAVAWFPGEQIKTIDLESGDFLASAKLDSWPYDFAFSDSSSILATAHEDGKIRIWNPDTLELIRTIQAEAQAITTISFDKTGTKIFSRSNAGLIKAWNTQTGNLLNELKSQLSFGGFSISPQKDMIAAFAANQISIWNADSFQKIVDINLHDETILQAYFSPDGTKLLSRDFANTVVLANTNTGKLLLKQYDLDDLDPDDFSPDSRRLILPNSDLFLIDGEKVIPVSSSDMNWCTAFSPDGTTLTSGMTDGTLGVVDLETGTTTHRLAGHMDVVKCLSFSPDGRRVASGSDDGTVKVWNLNSDASSETIYCGLQYVMDVAVNQKGNIIATAGGEKFVRAFDIGLPYEQGIQIDHDHEVWDVDYHPYLPMIAFGDENGNVMFFDVDTKKTIKTIDTGEVRVSSVLFSPSGNKIAIGLDSNEFAIINLKNWNIEKRVVLKTDFELHSVECMKWLNSENEIAVGHGDGIARVWDIQTGETIMESGHHTGQVTGIALIDNQTRLITIAAAENSVRIWDIKTGELVHAFPAHKEGNWTISVDADESRLAIGSAMEIIIFDLNTFTEVYSITGHTEDIRHLAFMPGDNRLISVSADGTARIWKSDPNQEFKTLASHDAVVTRCALNYDNSTIACGIETGYIVTWDLEGNRLSETDFKTAIYDMAWHPQQDLMAVVHGRYLSLWDGENITRVNESDTHNENTTVGFTKDGDSFFVTDRTGKISGVWNTNTLERISSSDSTEVAPRIDPLSDDRWQITPMEKMLFKVDLSYKSIPSIELQRKRKSATDIPWHRQQSIDSLANENWFAAVFHLAQIAKSESDDPDALKQLKETISKWEESVGGEVDSRLPRIAKELL